MAVPDVVFIVPYRDRPTHLERFARYFETCIRPRTDLGVVDVLVCNQCDGRSFNRGAMKNIGVGYLRHKYPRHYRNITCVFHDVDSIPLDTVKLDYTTVAGVVKHLYGFSYSLGGIVAMKCGDFERCGGFPNHWGWGYEDNALQMRCKKAGISIDRSGMIDVKDYTQIERVDMTEDKTVWTRYVSPNEVLRYIDGTSEGIGDVHGVVYSRRGCFLNVINFSTRYEPEPLVKYSSQLKDFMGNNVIGWVKKNYARKTMSLMFSS